MKKVKTKKLHKKVFNEHLKWRVIAALIATATNLTLFNIHTPTTSARATVKDVQKMFEHERETLHMPHNYGARARYTVILGNE